MSSVKIINKYFIIILIILLIITFICNYDVYVIEKGKSFCKIDIVNENFKNLTNDGFYYRDLTKFNYFNYLNVKSLNKMTSQQKYVIYDVVDALNKFQTSPEISNNDIKKLLLFYMKKYINSHGNQDKFINSVKNDEKFKLELYNSKFSILIMQLFLQFDLIEKNKAEQIKAEQIKAEEETNNEQSLKYLNEIEQKEKEYESYNNDSDSYENF
jgi:hypothetical protein